MANLFPTVPPGVEPPTVAGENGSGADSVPFGRSWKFDDAAGEFVVTPSGRIASTEGVEAWLEWCRKALRTERYKHLVYSRGYGQEFESLIGLDLARSAVESEIARTATETLMADPRTASVDRFSFAWDGERCEFSCEVRSVRDDVGTIQGSVVSGV